MPSGANQAKGSRQAGLPLFLPSSTFTRGTSGLFLKRLRLFSMVWTLTRSSAVSRSRNLLKNDYTRSKGHFGSD
jgi:hypothetical protein